jgi:hypothetical protein
MGELGKRWLKEAPKPGRHVGFAPLFLILRSHSIRITGTQGVNPKCSIGSGRRKDGRVGEALVEGGPQAWPSCWVCTFVSGTETTFHKLHRSTECTLSTR